MRLITFLLVIILFTIVPTTDAHSGRTDSSGGHNCNVGACAGTYHYHNGGSAPEPVQEYKPVYTAPIVRPTNTPYPTLTPFPSAVPTSTPIPTQEVQGRDTVPLSESVEAGSSNSSSEDLGGFIMMSIIGGLGYLGYKKLKN